MSKLTPEQLQRIEENRKKALEKRALREKIEANRKKALQTLAARAKARQKTVDDYRLPLSEYRKYYDPSLPNPVIKRFTSSEEKPATVTSTSALSGGGPAVGLNHSAGSSFPSSVVNNRDQKNDNQSVQAKNCAGTSGSNIPVRTTDCQLVSSASSSVSRKSFYSGNSNMQSISSSSLLDNSLKNNTPIVPSTDASRISMNILSLPKTAETCHSVSTVSSSVSKNNVLGGDGVKHIPSFMTTNSNPLSKINSTGSNKHNPVSRLNGGCRLVSTDRFVVDIGYHHVMIDIFKSIGSALYDSSSKKWSFHVKDHYKLLKELQILKDEVSVSGIPKKVLDIFLRPTFNHKNIELSNIDPELLRYLMPFQKEGVQYGISRGGRCLIADDMGLGKTIQALGIAHYYRSNWPLLIVCPTSVRYQWLEAFRTWLPSVNECCIFVMTSKNDFDESAEVLITSYSLVSRHVKMISSCKFGVVILDESHFLKAPKAARTEAAMSIIKRSQRVILLSGTPALSRPAELFTQLQAVDPKTFYSFREFGIRYCAGKQTPLGFWDYNGSSNMEELNLLLQKCFMIRRLKSDVLTELPSKIRQMVVLNPSDIKQSRKMEDYEKTLQNRYLKNSERRSTLLEYYSISGLCKLPAITEYISDKIESGKKFLVFAHHHAVLDGICETVLKKKVSFIRIDGNVSSANRKELCDKFQFDENCMVAVLSITAANTGITLTSAQLVIFAELFWNPGVLTQAEDRAHRIGQQDCVLVQYLVAPSTADDHLWPLIQSKLEVLNKAGLSKDSFQSDSTSTVMYNASHEKNIKDYFTDLGSVMNDDDDSALLEAVELANF